MKYKTKVTIDGQEREIEIDLDLTKLPASEVAKALNLMTREEVNQTYTPKDAFEAELARRVSSITKGHVKLEDLKEKPELRQQVFDLLGVKVSPDGKPQLTADQVAQLQEDWRKKELEPVNQRAEKAETRAQSLLRRILHADIVREAAANGVQKHLLSPVREGQAPPIVAMLGDVFGYSEGEHGEGWFVRKGEDGFEFSSDPKQSGSAYKTVGEFMREWATSKDNAPFVEAAKPGGAGLRRPGSQGGTVTVERSVDGRPMTLQEYKAAQEAAGEGGRVVVSDPTAVPS